MVYTEREKLTVLELTEERDVLSYDELIPLLLERPSNVIYVELYGALYGIVTIGRIQRTLSAEKRQVAINKKFKAVHEEENAYMYSRRIFREKDNIVFVPVVNSEGKLLGEWAKEDDLFLMSYMSFLADNSNVAESLKGCEVVLVKPCAGLKKKRQLFLFWKQLFEDKEISLKTIDFGEVNRYISGNKEKNTYLWTVDEIEARGAVGVLLMANVKNDFFLLPNIFSCHFGLLTIGKSAANGNNGTEAILHSLQMQNVFVLAFDFIENERGYLSEFQNKIQNKYCQNGFPLVSKLFGEMREEFFCEYNEKYKEQSIDFRLLLSGDGYHILGDMDTPLVHAYQGKRQTVGQPGTYERCIYVVGPCIVLGSYVEDQFTIPSLLQKKLNIGSFSCKVINLGSHFTVDGVIRLALVKALKEDLRQGDIVIFDAFGASFYGIQTLNLTDALEESCAPVEWVVDTPRHCNHKMNEIYAEAIYERLLPILRQPVESRKPIKKDDNIIKCLYIDQYFSDFDASKYEKTGSIVMNCNPFTFGHRYLIEYAANQVDVLIIFVVEEDASLFTFEERFAMVCEGTADIKNVKVVPSGEFILSKRSFPEYFIKEADEDIERNTENDITCFAEKIAPVLGITHRFVGEEPEDAVTNAYNQAMKKILPAHGIELVEIPRKQSGKAVISASRVRKCLEENDLETLDTLVPESTKRILFCVNE